MASAIGSRVEEAPAAANPDLFLRRLPSLPWIFTIGWAIHFIGIFGLHRQGKDQGISPSSSFSASNSE